MGGNTSRHRLRQPQRACMTPGIRWREISDVYLRNTWSIGRYEGRPAALFEARDCRRPGQHAGLGGQCLILPTPAGCSCGRADAFQSAGLPDLRPPGACVYRLHTGIPLAGRRVPAGRPDAFHPAGLAYLRPPGTCAYRLHTGIPLARCRVPAGRPELRAAQHRGGLADTATMGQAMPTGSRCLLPAGHLIGIGATGVDLDEGLISACGRLGPVFTLAGGSELSIRPVSADDPLAGSSAVGATSPSLAIGRPLPHIRGAADGVAALPSPYRRAMFGESMGLRPCAGDERGPNPGIYCMSSAMRRPSSTSCNWVVVRLPSRTASFPRSSVVTWWHMAVLS